MSYFLKIVLILILILKVNLVYGNDAKAGLPQLDLSTYPSLIFWAIISLFLGYMLWKSYPESVKAQLLTTLKRKFNRD